MNDLISLICPQCNAQIQWEENGVGASCPFCGTEFLIKDAMVAKSIDRLGSTVAASIRSGTHELQEEQRRMSIYNHLKLYEHCFYDHLFDEFHKYGQELMKLDSSDDFYRLKNDLELYAFMCCNPIIISEVLVFAAKMLGICLLAGIVLLFILGPFPVLNCVPFLLPLIPFVYVFVRLKQKKENERLMIDLHTRIEERFSSLKASFAPNAEA